MMRVVKYWSIWSRLPREVEDAPSLETFEVWLDGALSNWLVENVPAQCKKIGLYELKGTFQPKSF